MTVVVHHHIYKNAGSTVDWVLHQNFPGNVLHVEGDRPDARLSPAMIRGAALSYPDHKAITSHCAPLPDGESMWALVHLTFLRDPVDRLYSIYRFARRRLDDGPGPNVAKSLCFREYCEWWLGKSHTYRSNWQARCCTPQLRFSHAGESGVVSGWDVNLNAAQSAITKLAFVGTVEDFDKSMLLFECSLRQNGILFDAAYRYQNAAPEEPAACDDMRNHIVELMGRRLYDRFMEINSIDRTLFETARRLVHARFSALDDADRQLQQFRERCREKAEADPSSFVPVPSRDERIVVSKV